MTEIIQTIDACKAWLEKEGYTVFRGAEKPSRLPRKELYDCPFIPAPTLVDYRRSQVIDRTARSILSRGMRAINSKLNWRTLEQAYRAVRHLDGEIWEAGVFQGVTANVLANCIREYGPEGATLRLFDSFEGLPDVNPERDLHSKGNFANTSVERVKEFVGSNVNVVFHKGFIPGTFAGLEDARVKLVHIDLDLYQSILDTLAFCYPRMTCGVFVFDDYGTPSCPGALDAVDEFFADKPESVFCFSTGQSIAFKLPS